MKNLIKINTTDINDCFQIYCKGQVIIVSDTQRNSLLDMKQKEAWFMGKSKFKVSNYDLKKLGFIIS